MASSVGSDSVPTGMELALFQEYAALTHPQLLDKTGVYVVQPNGLQHHLHHVHKVGKGLLRALPHLQEDVARRWQGLCLLHGAHCHGHVVHRAGCGAAA